MVAGNGIHDDMERLTDRVKELERKMEQLMDKPKSKELVYDNKFGDDRICECGHVYYRHFDPYENMEAVGCKYCGCDSFKEVEKKDRWIKHTGNACPIADYLMIDVKLRDGTEFNHCQAVAFYWDDDLGSGSVDVYRLSLKNEAVKDVIESLKQPAPAPMTHTISVKDMPPQNHSCMAILNQSEPVPTLQEFIMNKYGKQTMSSKHVVNVFDMSEYLEKHMEKKRL